MGFFLEIDRATAVSFGLADDLEKGDGDQTPGAGDERIAGFVPVGVVFSADDVEEITLAEGQFLQISGVGMVVVESLDDLAVRAAS